MKGYTSEPIVVAMETLLSLTPTPPCHPPLHRNEWEPPDKKVDTRKYRVEPKSIFEYEPGKSSVLHHDRTVSRQPPLFLPLSLSFYICVSLFLSMCTLRESIPTPPTLHLLHQSPCLYPGLREAALLTANICASLIAMCITFLQGVLLL